MSAATCQSPCVCHLRGLLTFIIATLGSTKGIGRGGVERMIAYPLLIWGELCGAIANEISRKTRAHYEHIKRGEFLE